MSRITQSTLPKPEMSWRRNRSLATVMNSQNHRMNTKTAKASARTLANIDCPENSMVFLHPMSSRVRRFASPRPSPSRHLAQRERRHPGGGVQSDAALDAHRLQGDLVGAAAQQHVGANAHADGALGGRARIVAGERPRRDAARSEYRP